jgi:uncharacterized protein (TIGR03083 family)
MATDCPAWNVRQMAAHMLGMAEMAASIRENVRQQRKAAKAAKAGSLYIDALTQLQVDERAGWTPERITARYAAHGPKAAAGRRRAPAFVRRRTMPQLQEVNGVREPWTFGYLVDVILTRDPWMHRLDIAAATGTPPRLTADHDGVIVADVPGLFVHAPHRLLRRPGRQAEHHARLGVQPGALEVHALGGLDVQVTPVRLAQLILGHPAGRPARPGPRRPRAPRPRPPRSAAAAPGPRPRPRRAGRSRPGARARARCPGPRARR